ncbi:hypothetical protein F6A87_24345 [Escherichia coli]|jgi:hypothetical protein|nr:hypothetical protein AM456_16800 [Escherichia coli]EGF2681701.1 hypothetical protein [Shigella sonnei]EAC1342541.1 hypothetical protein [Escherichia coli]EEW2182882.1 hypothetical protein [Escherichia coli]EEX1740672.1 hypothetical protein [Escherichia coli]
MQSSINFMERRIKIQDAIILTMKLIVPGEIHVNIYLNNLTRGLRQRGELPEGENGSRLIITG